MNEDSHLEAAYEDRNGSAEADGPEELSMSCLECGAAEYELCDRDCINYAEGLLG